MIGACHTRGGFSRRDRATQPKNVLIARASMIIFYQAGQVLNRGLGVAPIREISMTNWFARPLTALAFLWRLERGDGVAIGFTSHDRDLVRGGFTYRATPGLVPSAVERTDGLEVGSVELGGALTSDALTEDDFRSGRWDGAGLWLWAADWQDAVAPLALVARGELGAVELSDGAFTVALRGPTAILDAPVVEVTSPECRAALGDRRCRVDLAGRRVRATVTAAQGEVLTLATALTDSDFAFGRLRWIDGPNAGLVTAVAANMGASVTLREAPAFAVTEPVAVELTEGCDKRLATCAGRFANAANFQGEPHLPGDDLLTRYGQL
jgi:uncharacterized phage protein (TIGR02218 family)